MHRAGRTRIGTSCGCNDPGNTLSRLKAEMYLLAPIAMVFKESIPSKMRRIFDRDGIFFLLGSAKKVSIGGHHPGHQGLGHAMPDEIKHALLVAGRPDLMSQGSGLWSV